MWKSEIGTKGVVVVATRLKEREQKEAGPRLRAGVAIGAKVTLRGDRMYDFLDKLFNVALPRIKDFKGISERAFDGRGNLNIGMKGQLIFPVINYDKVETIRGMGSTIVTTA